MRVWFDKLKGIRQLNSSYFIIVFCLSCLMLVIFTLVIYKQSRNVEMTNTHVTHSYEVLRKARLVLLSALNLETGQRGYLLTGSRFFLEPYTQSIDSLDNQVRSLRNEVRNAPDKVEFVTQLEQYVLEEKSLLKEQVETFQKKGAWALNIEKLKQSKVGMDKIRIHVEQFIDKELKSLSEWRDEAETQLSGYFITLFVGAALSIGGLILANLIILRLVARNRDAEFELQRFEESYQLLLSGIRDGIFDLYPDTGITQFSPSYKSLLGYPSVEMQQLAEPFRTLIHPDDYGAFEDELQRFIRKETEEFSVVHRMKRKDGTWAWLLARAVRVLGSDGNSFRIVGTHTDITAQKLSEEQLKQMNMELEGFTYIASHDLRAPLVNLKGFSAEMSQAIKHAMPSLEKAKAVVDEKDRGIIHQTFDKDIPEALGFIQSSVEKMDKLTTAILDLSRIGRRQYRTEPVDVNGIVKRCVDALAYEIIERGATVEIDTLPSVQADALAFEQIMSNLLDNAVKYLSHDRKGHITVKAKRMPGDIMFIVSDNGRGIADADRSRVFDIFRRASNSGDVRGIGMGMAYVQATVRKLGGRIWFDSTINQGTSFFFTLPSSGDAQ